MTARELITEHLDLWTGAVTEKSSSGRGSNGKIELTGIKKLRELILELAVRGKLANQDPEDEPAYALLERIEATKAKSTKKGRPSKAAPVEDHEKYFLLPPNWEWVRLGSIQEFTNGYAFKSSQFTEFGVGVIRIGDVSKDGKVTPKDMRYLPVAIAEDVPPQFFVHPQDLVITMTGDVKPGINDTKESFLLNQRVGKLTPYLVSRQFLFIYLTTVAQQKIDNAFGGVIPNVSTREINESVMGLPPLEEQHRIVQKVDELMALCDRLEQQTSDQLEAHETLVDTLLGTLTQSENATQLADNWARLAAHFDALFTTEQSIDKLKQTILHLAVMGRLVEQDAGDEPAEQLIERIATQKAETGNGKRRASKPPKSGVSESQPFQIPSTWAWVPLRQTGLTSTGKTPSTKNASFFSGDIPFIGPGQVTAAGKINVPEKHLSEEGILQSDEALPGDILTVCIGGSIGKTAIVTERCGFNQQLNKIRPVLVQPRYLLAAINADFFQHSIREKATGSATPIINRSKWESIAIPLAPLTEQKRIVQKVDELMALCDQLKERLNQANETRGQLAGAVVEQAIS